MNVPEGECDQECRGADMSVPQGYGSSIEFSETLTHSIRWHLGACRSLIGTLTDGSTVDGKLDQAAVKVPSSD